MDRSFSLKDRDHLFHKSAPGTDNLSSPAEEISLLERYREITGRYEVPISIHSRVTENRRDFLPPREIFRMGCKYHTAVSYEAIGTKKESCSFFHTGSQNRISCFFILSTVLPQPVRKTSCFRPFPRLWKTSDFSTVSC